jgi:hypothetical protein
MDTEGTAGHDSRSPRFTCVEASEHPRMKAPPPPTVTTFDLAAIEKVLDMGGGYVLNFSDRTFSMFFADLGIDIDAEFPEGSKAKRLRAFLRSAAPARVARALEALLAHRGARDGDETFDDLTKARNAVARLQGTHVAITGVRSGIDVLSLDYVHELVVKTDQRLASMDFEGAITTARTVLEAVLQEIERRLTTTPSDHKGDLLRMFKAAAKPLRIDEERADLDDNFKQVIRGLVQIVNGLAPIRNKMSDGHARQRKPAPHHARVIVNAAKTVSTFVIESYLYQRDKELLSPPVVQR